MTVGQAVVWASQNIDPKYTNPELTTSEPYVMGSHATCSGAWVSGPEDLSPPEYFWGYNRMLTVEGLFGAGDTVGGSAHKFSSGPKWTKRIVDEIAKTGKPVEGFHIERTGDIGTIMKASKKAQEFSQWASEKQREECPLSDLWISVKCLYG